MRAVPVAVLLLVLLAGCSAPADDAPPTTTSGGPIDLTNTLGLAFVDLENRTVAPISQAAVLAWMSPNATIVTWTESNFAVMFNLRTGAREVVPLTIWARVYDNATGLELAPGEARVRALLGGATLFTRPVPPGPAPDAIWTAASDDLALVGGEYSVSNRPSACANDIVLRGARAERTVGCHLRIAADGRAGWTEATGVRIREKNGTIVELTGFGSVDRTNGTVTGHENPIFWDDGLLMLRLTGSTEVALSEVVTAEGDVVAKLDGPRRIALHDVSADGRYLLVRTFDR